jgi:hypothetical protein
MRRCLSGNFQERGTIVQRQPSRFEQDGFAKHVRLCYRVGTRFQQDRLFILRASKDNLSGFDRCENGRSQKKTG